MLKLTKKFLERKYEILEVETNSSDEEALDLISRNNYEVIAAD